MHVLSYSSVAKDFQLVYLLWEPDGTISTLSQEGSEAKCYTEYLNLGLEQSRVVLRILQAPVSG